MFSLLEPPKLYQQLFSENIKRMKPKSHDPLQKEKSFTNSSPTELVLGISHHKSRRNYQPAQSAQSLNFCLQAFCSKKKFNRVSSNNMQFQVTKNHKNALCLFDIHIHLYIPLHIPYHPSWRTTSHPPKSPSIFPGDFRTQIRRRCQFQIAKLLCSTDLPLGSGDATLPLIV